ncbi:MAG TPA: amidohydrolase, partial [Burkholderiaceae bacterium]|nr:amidohydrolase [Burkholderiaceae bacterium]
ARYDGRLFDGHLHLNWENGFRFPVAEAFALMRANGVTTILATSRPNDGTHALVDGAKEGVRVVPFLRPYRVRSDVQTWSTDATVLALLEEEFRRGYYVGLGEFHLSGDAAASEVVRRTVDFARRHELWLHAHVDDAALEILYRHDPRAKIIWAHTGFSTPTEKVGAYLRAHPRLVCELSYRYGITGDGGRLTPEWRQLFEAFPDRFIVGSDTWIPQRWQVYGELMETYRTWLGQLPRPVADRIAHGNGERLFPQR